MREQRARERIPPVGGGPGRAPDPGPSTPGQLRRLLAAERLRPRRSLSQNFLTDPEALDAIVAAADLQAGEAVVEVGPGLGVLTRRLLAAGCRVLAVELDERLAAYLRRELGGVPGFDLMERDALALDPADCFPGERFKLVANIPYHITSPLLHHFLEGEHTPELTVLLIQREVAERVASPPGDMSYLSVFVQHLTAAEVVAMVPRTSFEPAPAVDSAILRLRRRENPLVEPPARESFYRVVQAGFRQRRKQIHNGLSRELPVDRPEVEAALAACAVDPDRRPQTLTVEEWVCLTRRLQDRLEEVAGAAVARGYLTDDDGHGDEDR